MPFFPCTNQDSPKGLPIRTPSYAFRATMRLIDVMSIAASSDNVGIERQDCSDEGRRLVTLAAIEYLESLRLLYTDCMQGLGYEFWLSSEDVISFGDYLHVIMKPVQLQRANSSQPEPPWTWPLGILYVTILYLERMISAPPVPYSESYDVLGPTHPKAGKFVWHRHVQHYSFAACFSLAQKCNLDCPGVSESSSSKSTRLMTKLLHYGESKTLANHEMQVMQRLQNRVAITQLQLTEVRLVKLNLVAAYYNMWRMIQTTFRQFVSAWKAEVQFVTNRHFLELQTRLSKEAIHSEETSCMNCFSF